MFADSPAPQRDPPASALNPLDIPRYTRYRASDMSSRPAPASEPLDKWEIQLRKGCLDLAILAILWPHSLYGLEILRELASSSNLVVPEGTVYPLLSRLKAEGLLTSEWVESDAGHPRKYYSLTEDGRRRVRQMARSWSAFSAGLERLLAPLRKEKR